MQVNHDVLTTIQEYRVHADPITGNDHTASATNLEDTIYTERVNLLDETPAGERVPIATWGELAILCSTASLTHAAFTNESFVRLFQLALSETLSTMTDGRENADAILPSNFPNLPPTEQTHERAHALREALKRDRDRWFVYAVDDIEIDTDGVPAAFWLRGATDTTASEQLATWYAAGDVPEELVQTLPAIPGQSSTSESDTSNNGGDDTTPDRDPDQAGLDMF